MNPDGGDATDITNEYVYPSGPGGPGADFCGASWSPNGAQIAYLREPNSPLPTDYGDSYYPELMVANADGSAAHELLGPAPTQDTRPNVFSCERPAWSPDGKQIAFDSHGRPDSLDGIYITTPTGGSARYLAPGLRPNWSPDGTDLAVTERTDDGTGGAHLELVVISAADGRTIADLGPGDNASWSPDGSKIVFDSATTRAVSTVNPDGTGLTPVTSDGQSHQPDWQARACDTGTSVSTSGASGSVNCRLTGG
jgi:Tol biopolymer transport system component